MPLVAAAVLLLGACGGGSAPAPAPAPGTSSGTSSAAPQPGGGTASPAGDYAVEPPGPLRGSTLEGPDMLVYSQDPLSEEMVEQIAGLRGVDAVEPLAMAQVPVEDKVINLAAVDPATYRRFVPAPSARLLEAWRRVAGGEIAVLPEMKRKIPMDDQGFLSLGNVRDAPKAHVGAYVAQVPQVDAVVNEKWGAVLGMKPGNALLVSTDITAPQALRKPIQQIAGEDASVQILGPDLDTSVQQTAFLVGSVADAVGTFNYTVLGGGRIAPDPAWVTEHIRTEPVPILGAVTCNKAIFPQLRAALTEVVQRGLTAEIKPDEYAGCYYPRFIAGSTKLSNHSFGLALDFNVPGNLRGTVGEMDRTVVAIFKKWGFGWGGDWRYTDPMHFEMVAIVEPRT
ncbi:M15 family metallopeptidase [Nocardioides sp. zg-578]|uniref:M15 family peptidase n=1 Tax=Nocardioides marmotae TaxID=2663857 RepID=A0A6I3JDQ8_9ACTN|nr:M15 family metallopeptidase [Nocardioides marmotae]MCR6032577.1 M15 family peptidase [Gordonia jinghuaiqii]MTB83430.1 M15 family peptidase [Nocardioides marmotae]MTB96225.1 M15 family peptidase [Nocardioides marmotae]QKE03242.1 M15 family metallopeptidase [Nocardioides marmotae]